MDAKKRFLKYALPHKGIIITIIVMVLLFLAGEISQPLLIGQALNSILVSEHDKFVILIFICGCLLLIGVIADFIFEYLVGILTQRIIKDIRDDVYQKINDTSIETIHNSNQGDLVQLEIGDIENVAREGS